MTSHSINRLAHDDHDFDVRLEAILERSEGNDPAIEGRVREIIAGVRERGDDALLEYTNRYDRRQAQLADLTIPQAALTAALDGLDAELRAALQDAADRVRRYHEKQVQQSWRYVDDDGIELGQQVTPLDRAGVYVPGGKAAYPSSVLMNVIPARVAGVGEVVMVVPTPDDQRNPLVLAAAAIAGVDRVFAIGGAQAVAALAYGTELVPRVDKIVGPGNAYVAMAKRLVFGRVGIDMIAGPSEVLIVADASADPDWVAMDLFAQAEHDELASAILITADADFAERVAASIERLLPEMERAEIIATALRDNGAIVTVADADAAAALVNRMAPEHLELALADPEAFLPRVRHAGAIFLGHYSAESLGDYCAGPNHVLPTSRTARFSSPLGVYDFQKRSSIIGCNAAGADKLAQTASVLARGEGLTAHARSAEYRRKP
ncbi:histidinol dehydrogenase [Methylohalomonas lacus]|uniref:Histidinol dehydrogenase n=1 Tax=Methylohalomonas lacus TaxID=398773 RepID=A0AAE3L0L7_9GAMM|nr:histidinol dehydrogenase [Methylohalomonas lacus]MCS3902230.1 histidinol dehydrogenase [Methylohalomonas lacus]